MGKKLPHRIIKFTLSPYMTQHLVRFGLYHMDRTRRPKPLTYQVAFDPETVQEEGDEGDEAKAEA